MSRKSKLRNAGLALCVTIACFATGAAEALVDETGAPVLRPVPESPGSFLTASGISLDQAVAKVRSRYGGRVISAETRGRNGKRVHVIKVLSDEGRVRTVKVDAESGKIR